MTGYQVWYDMCNLVEFKFCHLVEIQSDSCSWMRILFISNCMLLCWQVYNKIDQTSIEEVDRLAHEPHSIVVRLAW